jgi:hypothetical protein
MGTVRWQGDAAAVAQVSTVQVTAYDAATTYILTINGKTISVAGTTDEDGTATALAAAWNASDEGEALEVTASANTDTVTLTGDAAGKPFTVSSSVSGGTGTIGSVTAGTTATGPNHWDDADNWSGGAVPVNSDDVVIELGSDILYGLDKSAVTLASLTIKRSYTGKIGLPELANSGQTTQYAEYRDTFLKIGATAVTIGDGDGTGSGRIKINFGTVAHTTNVYGTGQALESGIPALLIKGSHASNVLNVLRGSVGVAIYAGETGQLDFLRMGYVANQASDAQVTLGSGVTNDAVIVDGGKLTIASATTTLNQSAGEVTILAGAHAAIVQTGGTLIYRGTGTVTAYTGSKGAVLDFSKDPRARTVSAATAYAGATIRDPLRTVTWTAGIDLPFARVSDLTLDLGSNINLAISAA